MVGSHGSNPRRGITKRLLAVFSMLALLATACGGVDETETTTASAATSDVEYGSWGDSGDSADSELDAAPESSEDGDTSSVNAAPSKKSGAPSLGSVSESGSTGEGAAPASPEQTAAVLAYAIQASEELSYSFEQGMSMQMNMMGLELDIAPTDAFVTGEVSGDDSRVLVDLGAFIMSMFDSMGMDVSDPLFADLLGSLGSMTMEVWIVGDTMVIDMSSLAASIGDLDPLAAAELSAFADGPVAVDLAALGALGGPDATALVQQYGQGAQVTDPAALLDALRAVDAVSETGSSEVNGAAVTVYSSRLSMMEYYAALDMDITDQLGAMEDFGVDPNSVEGEMIQSMLPAIENLTVDMTIMLDDAGLVRRIETRIDMGEMMTAMFSGDAEMSGMVGDIEVVVDTWQNFDNYGTDIVIAAPEATDRTSELAGLIES